MNECEDDNGGCEGTCVNTLTSYECRCDDDGYSLGSDGLSCEGKEMILFRYYVLFSELISLFVPPCVLWCTLLFMHILTVLLPL